MLNLPQTVTQSATTLTTYNYTADGTKLRTVAAGDSVDYDDGIQYTNSVMEFIANPEGRANIITGLSKYTYMYNLTDHLGNVRATIQRNNANWNLVKVMQENEYYSFGLRQSLYDITDNRYLYNGKEIQKQLTNQFDYGARFYDPVIARWTTIDPLAEVNRKWSPYGYVKNNPISRIDPDGMIDYVPGASEMADAAHERKMAFKIETQEKAAANCCGVANLVTAYYTFQAKIQATIKNGFNTTVTAKPIKKQVRGKDMISALAGKDIGKYGKVEGGFVINSTRGVGVRGTISLGVENVGQVGAQSTIYNDSSLKDVANDTDVKFDLNSPIPAPPDDPEGYSFLGITLNPTEIGKSIEDTKNTVNSFFKSMFKNVKITGKE